MIGCSVKWISHREPIVRDDSVTERSNGSRRVNELLKSRGDTQEACFIFHGSLQDTDIVTTTRPSGTGDRKPCSVVSRWAVGCTYGVCSSAAFRPEHYVRRRISKLIKELCQRRQRGVPLWRKIFMARPRASICTRSSIFGVSMCNYVPTFTFAYNRLRGCFSVSNHKEQTKTKQNKTPFYFTLLVHQKLILSVGTETYVRWETDKKVWV